MMWCGLLLYTKSILNKCCIREHLIGWAAMWVGCPGVRGSTGQNLSKLSNLWYKLHLRQNYCWSLRCSWSIASWHCSNYIFILDLTPGFNGLGKDNCKTRRETFKIWYLVWLILKICWQSNFNSNSMLHVVSISCGKHFLSDHCKELYSNKCSNL